MISMYMKTGKMVYQCKLMTQILEKRQDTIEPDNLVEILDSAIENYSGQVPELEAAIGMLVTGRRYGWKVMYLVHSKRTIKKYEKILGIEDIREILPETSDRTHKSVAWKLSQKVGNFWKAVKGEIKGVKSPEIEK